MTIEVDFWTLVGLGLSLITMWLGGVKLFFTQVDKRLDERFDAQDRDRQEQYAMLNAAFSKASEEERRRVDLLDQDMRRNNERMARMEQDIERMPSHDDLARLYNKLNALSEGVSGLSGKIDGIEANLRHIVGRLIDKGMSDGLHKRSAS